MLTRLHALFSLFGTLVFGLPLFLVSAYLAADLLYTHATRELSRSELHEVSGSVESTTFLKSTRRRSSSFIEVRLAGWGQPFRFDARWGALLSQPPGTLLRMSLKPDDVAHPLQPTHLNSALGCWPLIVTLPDGRTFSSFDSHNQRMRSYLQLYPWLILTFVVLALVLSTQWCMNSMARHSRRFTAQRKPFKNRLSLRLLKRP